MNTQNIATIQGFLLLLKGKVSEEKRTIFYLCMVGIQDFFERVIKEGNYKSFKIPIKKLFEGGWELDKRFYSPDLEAHIVELLRNLISYRKEFSITLPKNKDSSKFIAFLKEDFPMIKVEPNKELVLSYQENKILTLKLDKRKFVSWRINLNYA